MMRFNNNEGGYEKKVIRGYVKDEKKHPIGGAVVILEKIQTEYCKNNFEREGICIDYMMTNKHGEYCFVISDISSYYKVKVFA